MKLLNITVLYLFPILIIAQSQYRAPLDEDFLNQKEYKGYINPPYKIKHNAMTTKSTAILPSRYDLRDIDGVNMLPDVRNQSSYGTCWAFAAYASTESSWHKELNLQLIDLSESHMVKNHGYEFGINDGGNMYTATAYLTRLSGPLYETSDPYTEIGNDSIIDVTPSVDIPAYVDEVIWLGNNRNLVKQIIMKHGAVATSMCTDSIWDHYSSSDHTFLYNGSAVSDHGVSIVGWDDDMIITGGNTYKTSSPGAWIIRNSWGKSYNDDGYFYASYDDKYIGKSSQSYYGYTAVNSIDTLLDYAELGATTSYSAQDASSEIAYAAVKHKAHQDLFIKHVGCAILVEGSTVDLTICRSFNGQDYTDTLAQKKDIYCEFAGFKKIDFPVFITKGDFYLIVKYNTPGETFPLPAETYIYNYCTPTTEEGKMMISNDAVTWAQGGLNTDYDFDLAVKLYAQYPSDIEPYFTSEKTDACINQEVHFINNTVGQVDSFIWHIDNQTVKTLIVSDTLNFTFQEVGYKSITLEAFLNGESYSVTQDDIINIMDDITPYISVVNEDEYYARNSTIILNGNGAEEYQWYALDHLDGETGQQIRISTLQDSLWVYMHASMGECYKVDSTLLKIKVVDYDNIEDAKLLEIGSYAYNISNAYASVEVNEPTPTLGSCDGQTSWCEEGGLHNSIWFKFVAPSSERVYIYTHGFDNQIALYDATNTGTWNDIMSGDPSQYSILAANDDFNADDYSAVITEVNSLAAHKTYWIQLDGSAGGAEGNVDIVVSDSSPTDIDIEHKLETINTPSELSITGNNLLNAQVSICDSRGIQYLNTTVETSNFTWNNSKLADGFYIINIKCDDANYVYKTIIKQPWQLTIQER